MASISPLPLLPHLRHPYPLLPKSPTSTSLRSKTPIPSGVQCNGESRFGSPEGPAENRREALVKVLLSAALFPSLAKPSSAETDTQQEFRVYEDETNRFKISIPRDWLVGQGETDGIKSVTAFYPEETSDSNVSIAITGVGPDFTRLESFGNVDAFAENLVNGMDRSWKKPPGLAAKLIDSKAANGLYYIEYTMQNPGEKRRHLYSAIGMASNGWYNRLYTVTGQFMEDGSDKFRAQIQNSVSSFRLIK